MNDPVSAYQRIERAAGVAVAAVRRRDRDGAGRLIFCEIGAALFWLDALATATGRTHVDEALAVRWALDRARHGERLYFLSDFPPRRAWLFDDAGEATGVDDRSRDAYELVLAGRQVGQRLQDCLAVLRG
jgi:hypothetical protein